MSVELINWDNMPKEPGPMYPALMRQVIKCSRVAKDEAVAHQVLDTDIYTAFDHLRFGVEQLTGDEVPALSSVTRA